MEHYDMNLSKFKHHRSFLKPAIFILALGLILIFGCEKSEPAAEKPLVWQSEINGRNASCILECANEDIVVWSRPYLVRLNKYGDLEWKKKLSDDIFTAKHIIESDQGDLIVAGFNQGFDAFGTKTHTYGSIYKVDKKTVKRWTVYPFDYFTTDSSCEFLKQTGPDLFEVACVTYKPDSSILIMEINGAGEFTIKDSFLFSDSEKSLIKDIVILPADQLLFSMSSESGQGLKNMKTDYQGNIEWQVFTNKISSPKAVKILNEENESGFVFCGSQENTGWVMSVTDQGSIKWETTWNLHLEGSSIQSITHNISNNGYMLYGDRINGNTALWLKPIESDGTIDTDISPKYYFTNHWAEAVDITVSKDGHYVFSGYSDDCIVNKVHPDILYDQY